jgi:hypothetical protein
VHSEQAASWTEGGHPSFFKEEAASQPLDSFKKPPVLVLNGFKNGPCSGWFSKEPAMMNDGYVLRQQRGHGVEQDGPESDEEKEAASSAFADRKYLQKLQGGYLSGPWSMYPCFGFAAKYGLDLRLSLSDRTKACPMHWLPLSLEHALDEMRRRFQEETRASLTVMQKLQLYSNSAHVVGATPTGDLIEKGWLVPLKVYVAKEIDMTGVTKRAGEWKAEDVTERGIKIVGDVVHEWHKKTYEIFGKPVKTIVFCAGVEHGRELVKQFNEAGWLG